MTKEPTQATIKRSTTKRLWIRRRKISPKWIRVGSMPIDLSVCLNPRSPLLRSSGTLIQIKELRL
ncbi:hypothetical protein PHMEG_0005334 [Phytophthora megakarya]|uniref:Uncharacterized protein n=1 Tax=Phytophthora megakarya TaxID=4795 RepID=A0A225WTM2_9STRA|nr:hypothetical protein PHMEG_0005334 [Phytophthora megakarya]